MTDKYYMTNNNPNFNEDSNHVDLTKNQPPLPPQGQSYNAPPPAFPSQGGSYPPPAPHQGYPQPHNVPPAPPQGYSQPQYAPTPPPYHQNGYNAPQGYNGYNQPKLNPLALVSFISGLSQVFLWIFLFPAITAIITGHIGLTQTKRTGERGGPFAITGLTLGYIGAAFWLLFIFLSFVSSYYGYDRSY
jgi:hypothetical protein